MKPTFILALIIVQCSLFIGPLRTYAHHGQNLFATSTADIMHPEGNMAAVQASFFRPDLLPSTGQRLEVVPMYTRGVSDAFQLETHFHWMTDPAEGLSPAQGVFEGIAIAGKHSLPTSGLFPEGSPVRLAIAAQFDVPTAYAMKTLGAGPGGIFHLIVSAPFAPGVTFAANLSSLFVARQECVNADVVAAAAPKRHVHDLQAVCVAREPNSDFDWGFSVGLRKHLAGDVDASMELAKEVDYPPGMTTIIGFYWAPQPDLQVRWGIGFPTGLDEDVLSVRLGAAFSF